MHVLSLVIFTFSIRYTAWYLTLYYCSIYCALSIYNYFNFISILFYIAKYYCYIRPLFNLKVLHLFHIDISMSTIVYFHRKTMIIVAVLNYITFNNKKMTCLLTSTITWLKRNYRMTDYNNDILGKWKDPNYTDSLWKCASNYLMTLFSRWSWSPHLLELRDVQVGWKH